MRRMSFLTSSLCNLVAAAADLSVRVRKVMGAAYTRQPAADS